MLDEKSINTVRKIFSRHDRGYYHWMETYGEQEIKIIGGKNTKSDGVCQCIANAKTSKRIDWSVVVIADAAAIGVGDGIVPRAEQRTHTKTGNLCKSHPICNTYARF